jgi:phosphonate transport system permease protein
MKMLNGGEAATILLTFMVLVLAPTACPAGCAAPLDTPPAARAVALRLAQLAGRHGHRRRRHCQFRLLGIGFGALFDREAAVPSANSSPSSSRPTVRRLAGPGRARASGKRWPFRSSARCSRPAPACCTALPRWRRAVQLPAQHPALGAGTGLGHDHRAGRRPRPLRRRAGAGPAHHRRARPSLRRSPRQRPAGPRPGAASGRRPGGLAFLYGTLPGAAPQLIAYTLYRWEMNIRMAAILGFVGAGGLGQLLYFELSLFHHAQASTVIIAMLLLSIAVDQAPRAG